MGSFWVYNGISTLIGSFIPTQLDTQKQEYMVFFHFAIIFIIMVKFIAAISRRSEKDPENDVKRTLWTSRDSRHHRRRSGTGQHRCACSGGVQWGRACRSHAFGCFARDDRMQTDVA